MKKRIETFKDELKHLYDYQDEVRRIEGEIALLEYEMENVKGVDYSKQQSGSFDESRAMRKRLMLIEKKEKLEENKKIEEIKIKKICEVLKFMSDDERVLLLEVIVDRRKYREVCQERNISNTSSLFVQINGIIERAIKKAG